MTLFIFFLPLLFFLFQPFNFFLVTRFLFFTLGKYFPLLVFSLLRYSLLVTALLVLVTPYTSQGRASRIERKKRGKSNKRRSAGVESDDKEGMSVVIQRLATEDDQMGKVMEGMQAAQEQQMQCSIFVIIL